LVRFAPIFASSPRMLMTIFVLGFIAAVLGGVFKLMQNDVKRMLACSTMAQMGFMFMQCGLGLFPAAVTHLCWHGLFKANLFLCSQSAAKEKRIWRNQPTVTSFILALICGVFGSYLFALAIHIPWFTFDTRFILVGLSFIAA